MKDWQKICEGLNERKDTLRQWDAGFVESVLSQLNRGYSLSPNQTKTIDSIVERNTPEALERAANWDSEWDDEKKQIAKTIAEYYQEHGYFRDLVKEILDSKDNNFKMTERQYNAMCCNKYAEKVLDAKNAAPLYPVGSMAMVRTNISGVNVGGIRTAYRRAKTDLVVVLSTDEPIKSAAKGCKTYKVVFVGDSEPVTIEERDLKRMKKSLNKKKKSTSN
mgnify:FL=1